MNQHIQTVLDELYQLDPELRTQEAELLPILTKLLETKPDAEPDDAFVQRLRVMLRDKAALQPSPSRSLFSFLTMPSLNYAVTGAVLGAVITGPVVYGIMQSGGISTLPATGEKGTALFSYSVEDAGNRAFGDLSTVAEGTAYGRSQGGGGMGGAPGIDAAVPMNADVPAGSSVDQKIMPFPPGELTQYNLKFEGEMPALSAGQIEVLKRQKGVSSADVATIMRSFNTGLIDLGTFRNARADMISFYQDAPFGYVTTVSFREGNISINANWEKWPHPEAECRDEACFQRMRLKINDVPSDDAILGVAESFVREHGIDLSQYGEPEVDNLWRRNYEQTPDKNQFYIPDQIRVIYPLLVEGKPVYDEGGAKSGISIGVNIREKKVADAWGIMDQKYLKSAYPAVTDAAKITAYLENQGKMDTSWMPEGTKVKNVDVTLGTPELGYVKMYNYENNQSEELIVPALVFPVTNVPAGEIYYRDSVTVPLAADILEKASQMPDPRPLPVEPIIMEDGATLRAEDEE